MAGFAQGFQCGLTTRHHAPSPGRHQGAPGPACFARLSGVTHQSGSTSEARRACASTCGWWVCQRSHSAAAVVRCCATGHPDCLAALHDVDCTPTIFRLFFSLVCCFSPIYLFLVRGGSVRVNTASLRPLPQREIRADIIGVLQLHNGSRRDV